MNIRCAAAALATLAWLAFPLSCPAADPPAQGGAPSEPARRIYETRRLVGAPPRIDGAVADDAWAEAAWSGDFVQREPADGAPPSRPSQFKVVYDDDALYFAFRLFDDPARVAPILARHDWFPGDWIEVNIDSRADERTAYSFTLSLSGTRGDEYISEDGNSWNGNWDPVWEGAAHADDQGWTAEMRIPLSQLRFDPAKDAPWGLQVHRRHFRDGERSTWQRIPRDASGWVSRFGDLRGLTGLAPGRRLEVLPYAVAQHDRRQGEPGNPFRDGTDSRLSGGLDAKLGLGNDFSLDLTVNPDFGQVEADPSQVNLSAFETFFQEKRPFFIEGADVLNLPLAPAMAGGHFARDRLFYSRRLGHSPSWRPRTAAGEFARVPDQTSIAAAAKLAGKTADGLSVGILECVTARERADIAGPGGPRQEAVEPLTNWFVGRVTQDLRAGQTVVGGMLTSVVRDIDDPHLGFLERQAWAGGVDLKHLFRDRDFRLEARVLGSHLRGSEEAILGAQRSPARYFQRPDNDHAELDPSRTTLGGHAGSVMLTRTGNGTNLMYQVGGAWRSPGFEINDLGYMRTADEINQFAWVGYVQREPRGAFNSWQVNGNGWMDWDFGGARLNRALNLNVNGQLRGQQRFHLSASRNFGRLSNTELRGGPASVWPGGWELSAHFNNDERRALQTGGGAWMWRRDEGTQDSWSLWTEASYRPSNSLRLALNPSWERNDNRLQYVGTSDSAAGDRYLFGRLDQRTFSLVLRLDLCLTPALTVQYYGAPFVSAGRYESFRRVADPRADSLDERFRALQAAEVTPTGGGYEVDEDGDGAADYAFGRPDFNVRDFNSNLVVRWEYGLGSTLYLVWSQGRSDVIDQGAFSLGDDLDALFGTHPRNTFLVKVNRWLSL
ncbi:carbohydrate binding family 9 domain-containing protein [bacterium]|nr:carbohydrate binding family 9 domain-containing protein [bacterium]